MKNNDNETEKKVWIRKCPKCSKDIIHKNKESHRCGVKKNKLCGFCSRQNTGYLRKGTIRTDEFKNNLSIKLTNHPSIKGNKKTWGKNK